MRKLAAVTVFKALLLALLPGAALAETCLEHPYESAGAPALAADLAAVRAALEPFESLRQSLDSAKPRICLTEEPSDALGSFEAEENVITVSAGQPGDKRVAVLLHEIRHLDQYARGFCPSMSLDMRANARAVFALEADAMAIAHLVAWAAGENGAPGPFAALRSSDETADIAAAFETAMAETGDPSAATAAAFDAWYTSDARRERYYVSTCMAYLDRIEDDHLFGGTAGLSADFLAQVCDLPDGTPYPCEEPVEPLPR